MADQFSSEDAEKLRKLADKVDGILAATQNWERKNWLMATLKVWAVWITAVILGFTSGFDAIKAIAKSVLTK